MGMFSSTPGSTTTTVDPQTAEYQKQMWNAAQNAAHGQTYGVDPATSGANDYYGAMQKAGNLGMSAMQGNQGAYQQLANPYQQNVTDQTMQDFGRQQQQTMNNINDQATQAGAFGGSRHGVAEGVALGQLGQGQQQQLAQMNLQGYNDTMGRAQGMANLGMQGAGGADNYGRYAQQLAQANDPNQRMMQYTQGALSHITPGQVQTQQAGHNPLSGALGGALAGFASGGPWGAVAGGLGGLFG